MSDENGNIKENTDTKKTIKEKDPPLIREEDIQKQIDDHLKNNLKNDANHNERLQKETFGIKEHILPKEPIFFDIQAQEERMFEPEICDKNSRNENKPIKNSKGLIDKSEKSIKSLKFVKKDPSSNNNKIIENNNRTNAIEMTENVKSLFDTNIYSNESENTKTQSFKSNSNEYLTKLEDSTNQENKSKTLFPDFNRMDENIKRRRHDQDKHDEKDINKYENNSDIDQPENNTKDRDQPIFENNNSLSLENNTEIVKERSSEKGITKEEAEKSAKSKSNQKKPHSQIKNNQISHASFENFTEQFFKELDYKTYDFITKETKIRSKKNEENYAEKLISALIDEGEMEIIPFDSRIKLKNLDEIEFDDEAFGQFLIENIFASEEEDNKDNEFVRPSVDDNDKNNNFVLSNDDNIENKEDADMNLYRKQVEINNKRKKVLKEILRERMLYKAYLSAIRVIDQNIAKICVKRIRNKKRYKEEEFINEINDLIERRNKLKSSYSNLEGHEDKMYDLSEIFKDDNVKIDGYTVKKFFL